MAWTARLNSLTDLIPLLKLALPDNNTEIGDKGSELEALLRLGELQKDARRLVSRSFGR